MPFYVVVQRARGRGALAPAGALDPLALGAAEESEWKKLCGLILRRARHEPMFGTEVLLCLIGIERPFAAPDRSLLERLLTLARERTWGGRIFLVAPTLRAIRPDPDRVQPAPRAGERAYGALTSELLQVLAVPRAEPVEKQLAQAKESWQRWMETGVEGRALNLLQLPYDADAPASIHDAELRAAVDRVDERSRLLAAAGTAAGRWRCCLLDRGDEGWTWAREVLGSFVQSRWDPDVAERLVLVVDAGQPIERAKAKIARASTRHGGRCRVVALVRRGGPGQPRLSTEDLRAFCHRLGPPAFEFRGVLELWYFLVALNSHLDVRASAPRATAAVPAPASLLDRSDAGRARWVPLDQAPAFRPVHLPPASVAPEILVTSAFHPNVQSEYLDAARDIGRFIEHSPRGLRFLVEPAATPGRLIRAVEHHPNIAIWIHLGHGNGRYGLQEADTPRNPGGFVPPQRWLDCFKVHKPPLAVAMFLTCESSLIAERFARAGVTVAVGFEHEAWSKTCRDLAVEILKGVFVGGTAPGVVQEAFERGCYRLRGQEIRESKPVAFFAERG
jgi:hypothetical protein